jgi:hypothetical protein
MPQQPEPEPIEERKKESKKILSKEKPKSNFPDYFSLDMATQKVADSFDLTDNQVLFEIEAMRDWAVNAGSKGLRKDWQAFARTWFRNNKGKHHGKNSTNTIKGGFAVIDAAIENLRQRETYSRDSDGQANPHDIRGLLKIAT